MSVCLLVDDSSAYDQSASETWQSALDLWQLSWRTCPAGEIAALQPAVDPVLVIDGFTAEASLPWDAINRYVRGGGHLIIAGMPGVARTEAREAERELTGAIVAWPGTEARGFPSLLVMEGLAALSPWKVGEVLFFTNPAFSGSAGQMWGRITAVADPQVQILATTYWTTVLPQAKREAFAGSASDEPGLVGCRPFSAGGQVLYTPIPLGLLHQVMTPQQVEVDSYPYSVANHGVFLLIKSMVCHLLGAAAAPAALLDLWPGGAAGAVCLTGDVHEFHSNPSGNAREEYRYIARMADLVEQGGAPGKFTFYVTGLLAEKHPEALQSAQDWDFGGHTYSDTGYVDEPPPGYAAHGDSNPEAPDLTIGREAQKQDVAQTMAALGHAVPDRPAWRRNWRTHYVASTVATRELLAEQRAICISDTGLYWAGEWQPDRFGGRRLITYVSYPQRSQGTDRQPLDLWEAGECIPSDYALWVSSQRHPGQPWGQVLDGEGAYQVWTQRLERAWRSEELLVINWHPFHSLQVEERAETLRRTMAFVRHLPGMLFMSMTEVAQWWDARASVRIKTVAVAADSLSIAAVGLRPMSSLVSCGANRVLAGDKRR